MEHIDLTLEWGLDCPLWYRNKTTSYPMSFHEVSISDQLKNDLGKWNRIFQATLDQIYPPESGFTSKIANELLRKALKEEGMSLCHRLREELAGRYEVDLDVWWDEESKSILSK